MIDESNNKINQYDSIKIFLEEFLNKLTVQIDAIEVMENDIHPIVLIKTGDSGVLIGNNGENLRALNHLVKKIAEKKFNQEERLQFLLDVNGYHRKRIETLKNQAKILAERARMFKSNVEMSPMNAYERMIIHATFSNDAEIKTESEGEGKMRRVVLKYKDSEADIKNHEVGI